MICLEKSQKQVDSDVNLIESLQHLFKRVVLIGGDDLRIPHLRCSKKLGCSFGLKDQTAN